eukprot:GHVO01057444.1.p2 GENE.GHVO01057444.1~~GHVO01057444.1.p2  ORF type:complete len:101 (+),score=16.75 GHVO01057444.1:73-375(+)
MPYRVLFPLLFPSAALGLRVAAVLADTAVDMARVLRTVRGLAGVDRPLGRFTPAGGGGHSTASPSSFFLRVDRLVGPFSSSTGFITSSESEIISTSLAPR